jgi:hypothetical protein
MRHCCTYQQVHNHDLQSYGPTAVLPMRKEHLLLEILAKNLYIIALANFVL